MKKVYVGIQDGYKEGWGEQGLEMHLLNDQFLFTSPGYRPYWIAETTQEIWDSWQLFIGGPTVNYTGLNYSAWELFWDTYMKSKVLKPEEWKKWKEEHGFNEHKSAKEDA